MTSSGECEGDRATAVRLGQDLVSHRLLTPVCAGYDRPKDSPGGSSATTGAGAGAEGEPGDLFGSFDDAAGWLFAFEGDALRNPFAPPPPIHVAVMTNTGVQVSVTGWVEVRHQIDCGAIWKRLLFGGRTAVEKRFDLGGTCPCVDGPEKSGCVVGNGTGVCSARSPADAAETTLMLVGKACRL